MELTEIHKDKRGSIYSLTGSPISLPEYSLMETKAGLCRGGCIHRKHSEHLVVLEGEIVYYYRLPGKKKLSEKKMSIGDSITIPPSTPHYVYSITNSVIMEFGVDIDEKKEKYAEFRKIVETVNNHD